LKIRQFKEHDKTALAELFLESRVQSWSWLDSSKWSLEDFENFTQDEFILVAEQDQQHLGFASIYKQDNFLHHLFISPDFQNQGVGSALLNAAEQLFTSTGYLKCLSENKQALAFYHRHNWKIIDTGDSEDGQYFLMSKDKLIK